MHSLPTPAIADLVREANHRLHFDPVACLPHEIISHIFEYLEPRSLCNASLTSRAWKLRAYDPRLWRRLFNEEGWICDREKLEALESSARNQKRSAVAATFGQTHGRPGSIAENPKRYRTTPPIGNIIGRVSLHPGEDGSLDLPEMYLDIGVPSQANIQHDDAEMIDVSDEASTPHQSKASTFPPHSKLLTLDPRFEQPILNWQYVYTQRRRLEKNWHAGHFTNFRLPHPDYQDEAHTQCVYTIQFSESHLVSGSRDKTVRVWDLNTQRLRLPPLEGHTGSVLCLQFDERPDQDIIVSGGSDADVIIWRFSDGALLNRMESAHTESVLNLRFDNRYLVTCSKDKSIRVWNRQSLLPNHADYPDISKARNARYPDYIVNIHDLLTGPGPEMPPALKPYTLLMTLDGHSAAVNALQIHDYEVVSASGDRKIMLWNIKTGELTRVFNGHTKGIACIQYDGRRIVSGSSDNTVRIFDASTSAELATLDGHRNLVRTVQAEFGDMGMNADFLEAEARRNDARVRDRKARRAQDRIAFGEPLINLGGPDSEDEPDAAPFVTGAKLPPGGGGTRWSKIVSGSYDETLIVWRRDRNGRWYIAKELRQEDALRSASRHAWRSSAARRLVRLSHDALPATIPQLPGQGGTPQEHATRMDLWRQQLLINQARAQQAREAIAHSAGHPAGSFPQGPVAANGPPIVAAPQPPPAPTLPREVPNLQAAQQSLQPGQTHHAHHPPRPPGLGFAQQQQRQMPLAPRRPHHHHQNDPAAVAAAAAAAAVGGAPSLNNRVFKLQFDARRIVCCSQEPVIVGWDFAAGEKEVENVSWLFGVPR